MSKKRTLATVEQSARRIADYAAALAGTIAETVPTSWDDEDLELAVSLVIARTRVELLRMLDAVPPSPPRSSPGRKPPI
jgi:hypothetical protein